MAAELARALHRDYVVRVSSDSESFEFQVSEHLRLSGVYWGACALHLIDSMSALDASYVVSFVRSCQRGCGGFAGNLGHDAHMLYTLSAVQILALFDALDTIDEDRVMAYVASLQRPDGSFAGDEWGEVDTRFSYCALCCASLLGRLDALDVASAVAYVQRCQNFDGGYGCEPGGESHAGQIFTCVGALSLAGCLDRVQRDQLCWWLCERQTPGGGLNGRPQKDADVCYSWWVLSALSLLDHTEWIDAAALRAFILSCQDLEEGGIADKPGDVPDVFHTFFGIAGLSLLGSDHVPPIDAAHAMPLSVMQTVRARNAARGAARAATGKEAGAGTGTGAGAEAGREAGREAGQDVGAVAGPPLMRFAESAFTTRVEYQRWAAEMMAGKRGGAAR